MVSTVPLLFLSAAGEAFAISLLFPQYLPHNPFVWTLIRTTAANVTLYVIYHVFIWPFFLTPLRHLPQPGVRPLLDYT
jgi:hypothetical protein